MTSLVQLLNGYGQALDECCDMACCSDPESRLRLERLKRDANFFEDAIDRYDVKQASLDQMQEDALRRS